MYHLAEMQAFMGGNQVFDLFGKVVFCWHTVNFILNCGAQIKTVVCAPVDCWCLWNLFEAVKELVQNEVLLVKCNSANQKHRAVSQQVRASHEATGPITVWAPHVHWSRAMFFVQCVDALP